MIPYLHRTGRKRKRSRKFKIGYDRTGGFYGRFRKRRKHNNTEMKFYDINILADQPISLLGFHPTKSGLIGTTRTLIDIPQGTGEQERIGRKITIKSVHIRLIIFFPVINDTTHGVAAGSTGDIVRTIVYCDKQCNGATATATDILAENKYTAFRNLANTARFRILVDTSTNFNRIAFGGNSVATSVFKTQHWYKNIKINLPIEYSGTTGNLSEIRSNNIGIIMWSERADANLGITSRIRIRFTDK